MPQAKTEVALQFSECCAAETALQHWLFCSAEVIWTKSCTAANENCTATSKKLRCKKVALSCRFPAGFKPPRLGTHVSDLLIDGHLRCFAGRTAPQGHAREISNDRHAEGQSCGWKDLVAASLSFLACLCGVCLELFWSCFSFNVGCTSLPNLQQFWADSHPLQKETSPEELT